MFDPKALRAKLKVNPEDHLVWLMTCPYGSEKPSSPEESFAKSLTEAKRLDITLLNRLKSILCHLPPQTEIRITLDPSSTEITQRINGLLGWLYSYQPVQGIKDALNHIRIVVTPALYQKINTLPEGPYPQSLYLLRLDSDVSDEHLLATANAVASPVPLPFLGVATEQGKPIFYSEGSFASLLWKRALPNPQGLVEPSSSRDSSRCRIDSV